MYRFTAPLGAFILCAAPAFAQAPDYGSDENWLCLPGREDACQTDLTTTVIEADGRSRIEEFMPAEDPGVDCFYVYPTVSTDPTGNSDLSIDPAETNVAQRQFARLGEVCNLYAPMYRQVTLAGLGAQLQGKDIGADWGIATRDVAAAFGHYMASHNDGKPYVLVSHSQGSIMLKTVIPMMIADKPAQENLLSAILMGYNIALPEGAVSGGELGSVPLCESADQTGCAVAFASFKDTNTPPEGGLFGRVEGDGMVNACVNPAALLGRDTLDSYFAASYSGSARPGDPWGAEPEIETDWVSTPGLVSGECVDRDGAQFFAITVNADETDPRSDDIGGEMAPGGMVSPQWGLHLIDAYLVQGDLIDLIRAQTAAYSAQ